MEKFKNWGDLSPEQTNEIMSFKPPKYYRLFYRWFKKWIGKTIFSTIILIAILGIIYNNTNGWDFWNILMGFFIFIAALGFWALSAYLVKHFYTKKFAKKLGLSLENWNYLTQHMTWD
jgi:hypothetical protein